jgi:hypothetical protein
MKRFSYLIKNKRNVKFNEVTHKIREERSSLPLNKKNIHTASSYIFIFICRRLSLQRVRYKDTH